MGWVCMSGRWGAGGLGIPYENDGVWFGAEYTYIIIGVDAADLYV